MDRLRRGRHVIPWFDWVARAVLGVVLLYGGLHKLGSSGDLSGTLVEEYLGNRAILTTAALVEAGIGIWILTTRRVALAWLVASLTFGSFSIVRWRHVWAGDSTPCGCLASGRGSATSLLDSAARASLLWMGCVLGSLAAALQGQSTRSPEPPASVLGLANANVTS